MRTARQEILKAVKDYVKSKNEFWKVEEVGGSELHVNYQVTFTPCLCEWEHPFNTICRLTKDTLDVERDEVEPGLQILAQEIATIVFNMDDEMQGVNVRLVRTKVQPEFDYNNVEEA